MAEMVINGGGVSVGTAVGVADLIIVVGARVGVGVPIEPCPPSVGLHALNVKTNIMISMN